MNNTVTITFVGGDDDLAREDERTSTQNITHCKTLDEYVLQIAAKFSKCHWLTQAEQMKLAREAVELANVWKTRVTKTSVLHLNHHKREVVSVFVYPFERKDEP